MKRNVRHNLMLLAGIASLCLLTVVSILSPPHASDLPMACLFSLLITFALAYGVKLPNGEASLMWMTVTSSYLILGKALAGWSVFIAVIIHGFIRYFRSRSTWNNHQRSLKNLVRLTALNIAMHVTSTIVGGYIFELLGGTRPLSFLTLDTIWALFLSFMAHGMVNYALVSAYLASRSLNELRQFIHSIPNALLYEAAPLVFTPLMVLIYTKLGLPYFLLLALAYSVATLVAYYLATATSNLQRRLQELDSLQAVGHILESSLDIAVILNAIYDQVCQLMPAEDFYVALYDKDYDEVRFPLAIVGGKSVSWRSRRTGQGLTEYIIRTQRPLLIRNSLKTTLEELGVSHIGHEAKCWLGIPITAGEDTLGVIAVQNHTTPDVYDLSHQEILSTIAAQAAVAIKNARLYEQTDEALARRVQELDSVLRTTRDGVILLDLELRILTANRAVSEYLAITQTDLFRQLIKTKSVDERVLLEHLGYELKCFDNDISLVLSGEADEVQQVITIGPNAVTVERTLTPVYNIERDVIGWLLVFRDMTEEVALSRLREDMTNMLVHDLRSPLTIVIGSLEVLAELIEEHQDEQIQKLLNIAGKSSDRILHMVNQLLAISKLESGEVPLERTRINAGELLREVIHQFESIASAANILIVVESQDDDIPSIDIDRQLMSRVIHNLVDNAIKYTPEAGSIRLFTFYNTEGTTKEVILGVSDTGSGIPDIYTTHIFDKFGQLPDANGRRVGTGLGLPFCRLVVEAHRGRIWVESEVGKGSTFYIALPV